jgi:hypothetical protein
MKQNISSTKLYIFHAQKYSGEHGNTTTILVFIKFLQERPTTPKKHQKILNF